MVRPALIGNGQGFWGDHPDAPARLVAAEPRLDYLTLDYLAEVSMSILAASAVRGPPDPAHAGEGVEPAPSEGVEPAPSEGGFVRDFVQVVRSLAPFWRGRRRFRLISNAGGLNPLGCARACAEALEQDGCRGMKIATVSGDDVLPLVQARLRRPEAGGLFDNLDTGEPLVTLSDRVVAANAYLGAGPIVAALSRGADLVITGRTCDPSLTVAPAVYHFGWSWDDYDRIAGATVAGHLIECGAQVTGGIATDWLEVPDVANIGYPFVEINEDGSCVVTKPAGTGGRVSEQTVKEQLLYEIEDPNSYLSPDVVASFLSLRVDEVSENRVRVAGAKGRPPTATYKVSVAYRAGYRAQALLTIFGRHAERKARRLSQIVLERIQSAGFGPQHAHVECLGTGDCVPGVLPYGGTGVPLHGSTGETPVARGPARGSEPLETVLRIAVADSRKEVVDRFAREVTPLITCGPQGTTGYSEGRPRVHPVFGYWPCLIRRHDVEPVVEMCQVGEAVRSPAEKATSGPAWGASS